MRSASLNNILGPSPEADGKKLIGKPGRKVTVLLVLMTALVGTRCEDVGVVNALAGALMGVMICQVLPALLFMQTARLQIQAGHGAQGVLVQPLLASNGRRMAV